MGLGGQGFVHDMEQALLVMRGATNILIFLPKLSMTACSVSCPTVLHRMMQQLNRSCVRAGMAKYFHVVPVLVNFVLRVWRGMGEGRGEGRLFRYTFLERLYASVNLELF